MLRIIKYKWLLIIMTLMVTVLINGCTKAELDDDFTAGDPPAVAGGYTNSRQIAAANLVGYWAFDGSITDSATGIVGSNKGMSFAAGLKGQSLQGDSANKAYATAPSNAAISAMSQYTVSFWVNTPQNVGATGIVSIGDTKNFWGNINVFFENGGTSTKARFKTIFEDSGRVFDNGIQDVEDGFNKWVQYVITYDGANNFKSYVNGSLSATKTDSTIKRIELINAGPVIFGTLHFMTTPSSTTASGRQDWAGYLIGKLDEVRIYNKALTPTEISALTILEKQGR